MTEGRQERMEMVGGRRGGKEDGKEGRREELDKKEGSRMVSVELGNGGRRECCFTYCELNLPIILENDPKGMHTLKELLKPKRYMKHTNN